MSKGRRKLPAEPLQDFLNGKLKHGWSKDRIADQTGLQPRHIVQILEQKSVGIDLVDRIAVAFSLNPTNIYPMDVWIEVLANAARHEAKKKGYDIDAPYDEEVEFSDPRLATLCEERIEKNVRRIA